MMRKTLIVSLSLLAAFALADGLLIGTFGKGRLVTSDGRTGSFDYEATKRTASTGASTLAGRLRFEQQPNAHGPYVLIEMVGAPTAVSVSANGNVGEFSGHAILTTLVNGQRVRFGGTAGVRAVDRRNGATGVGDPDSLRVRFLGEKGLTFASEGLVVSGDLAVYSKALK